MRSTHFISLAIFLFSALPLIAQVQHTFCGTVPFESKSLEEWREHRPDVTMRSSQDTLYVQLKVHLVGTDEGEGYYPLTNLFDSFCKLNKDMASTGIQLEMDPDINYIAKSSYNDHNRLLGRQMMTLNNVANKVNCYIVANPNGTCGYYSPQADAVALSKSCLGSFNTTWSHELGHYFSLPHTFNGWEGTNYNYGDIAPERVGINNVLVEKTDSSNCNIAGDGFCDTPPDYLSFRWNCSGSTSPDTLVDPDSAKFLVEGKYIMSYSNDACAKIFSEEQISAMRFNIQSSRADELSNNAMPQQVNFNEDEFIVYSGKELEELQYDDVQLVWSQIPNATHYLIFLSEKSFFPGPPDFTIITQDTFLNLQLEEDTRYEWELMGFNERYTCSRFSDDYEFYARNTTSSADMAKESTIKFYPNPLPEGETLFLTIDQPMSGKNSIEIYSVNGRKVYQKTFEAQNSGISMSITDHQLHPGLYFIRYRTDEYVISRKLWVQ